MALPGGGERGSVLDGALLCLAEFGDGGEWRMGNGGGAGAVAAGAGVGGHEAGGM
jgi:hypothetical protein